MPVYAIPIYGRSIHEEAVVQVEAETLKQAKEDARYLALRIFNWPEVGIKVGEITQMTELGGQYLLPGVK